MKNRSFYRIVFIVGLIACFNINTINAQVTSTANNTGWIDVNSYSGKTTTGIFAFYVHVNGADINHPNWSMLVRTNPQIQNSEGKTIDPSKLSIRFNRIEGGLTLQEIGANTVPLKLSATNQPILKKSNYPLKTKSGNYSQYIFYFDIIVEGGAYMESLKSWNNYNFNMYFTVRKEDGSLLTESNTNISMRIYPTDILPTEPTYGILVNGDAKNGILEFNSVSDYVNGVSKTYPNGLSVSSQTPYAVQVRSLTNNFESGSNILPVSTVSLEIKDPGNNSVGGSINLSGTNQTVFNAVNVDSKERKFNLRYFTTKNDERLFNARPANYQATLQYTLLPQ